MTEILHNIIIVTRLQTVLRVFKSRKTQEYAVHVSKTAKRAQKYAKRNFGVILWTITFELVGGHPATFRTVWEKKRASAYGSGGPNNRNNNNYNSNDKLSVPFLCGSRADTPICYTHRYAYTDDGL